MRFIRIRAFTVTLFVTLSSLATPSLARDCSALLRPPLLVELINGKAPKSVERAFGGKASMKPQTQRFDAPLRSLFEVLGSSDNGAEVAKTLIETSSRDTLYQLDALIRGYRDNDFLDSKTKGRLEKSKETINELSRFIGAATDARRHFRFVRRVLRKDSEYSFLVGHFREKRQQAQINLADFLNKSDWLTGKRDLLKSLAKATEEIADLSPKKDRRSAVDYVLEQIEEISSEKSLYEKQRAQYTPEDFEVGPHNYRKRLRRILATISAFSNLFRLVSTPSHAAEFKKLNIDTSLPIFSRYLERFSKSENDLDLIPISRELFITLIDYVRRIGAKKDLVQAEAAIIEALEQTTNLSSKQIRTQARLIAKGHKNYEDPYNEVENIFLEMRALRYLDLLASEIRRNR